MLSNVKLSISLVLVLLVTITGCKKKDETVPATVAPTLGNYYAIRTAAIFYLDNLDNFSSDTSKTGVLISTSPGVDLKTSKKCTANWYYSAYWINDLTPNTIYYVKTYLVNGTDVKYSEEKQLLTSSQIVYQDMDLTVDNNYSPVRAGKVFVVRNSKEFNIEFDPNVTLYNLATKIYLDGTLYKRPDFGYAENRNFYFNTNNNTDGYYAIFPCTTSAGNHQVVAEIDGVSTSTLTVNVEANVPYSSPIGFSIDDKMLSYGSESLIINNFTEDNYKNTLGIVVGSKIFHLSGDGTNYLLPTSLLTEVGRGVKEVILIDGCGDKHSLGNIEII